MIVANRTPQLRFPEFTKAWSKDDIGKHAYIYDGTHQTPKYVEHGVPFVSVENINDIENPTKFVTPEAFESDYKIKPQKGDILMTRITAGIIGATAIVKNNDPLAFYVSLALIRIKNDRLLVEFLNQYIATDNFKRELHKRIIHIAFPKKINLGEINHCRIGFPAPAEQQKIASFLTAIDMRIQLLQKKKAKLEEYKKGVMKKLFSQEIRFKDDNGNVFPDWEEKKLGEICEKQSSNISANSLEANGGDYKIYGATGFLQFVDFYREEDPYISIVKDGAGVGRILLCEAKSSVLGTLDILKPKAKNNIQFLYALISTIRFEKYITGSTIPHIYFKDYSKEKVEVPIPEEQNKIAAFLTSLEEGIESLGIEIEATTTFKKGLLQKMFV